MLLTNGTSHYGHKTYALKPIFNLDIVLWFIKAISKHALKFQIKWFGPYIIQYCLPNNIILLVIIDKLDSNPVPININKLKPYMNSEDKTLQLVLPKLIDLVINEHVQTIFFEPLLVQK